ncbi:MAG: NUDIX domain-containing protein [Bacilli bacterium]|nr:NUDIX domain-containing protein [Bacilli bacterium]MBR3209013.1 NUDIX domain-containing protein [Bacilli bacterium]
MKHFCASVFVINPLNKKILLVKHGDYDKWLQPGGHIEEDETPEDAAKREIYEETGLKITLLGEHFPREDDMVRPLGIQCNRKSDGTRFIDIIYFGKPNNPDEPLKKNNESTQIGWFSRTELDRMPIFQDVKITMDYILREYFNEN